jgi:hypothetical protein
MCRSENEERNQSENNHQIKLMNRHEIASEGPTEKSYGGRFENWFNKIN